MLVLSLNLGLKSVRAIVFDRSGQTIASEALPVTTTLKGGMVEQCPDEWWDKLCAVVKAVTEEWLAEFERIQLMLRLSGRLRQKHGD